MKHVLSLFERSGNLGWLVQLNNEPTPSIESGRFRGLPRKIQRGKLREMEIFHSHGGMVVPQ